MTLTSTSQPTPQSRQWDTICLTIVTIYTATIGASIVLAGIPDLSAENGPSSIIKASLAFLSTSIHATLTGLTALVIFRQSVQGSEPTRRRISLFVYLLFFTIIILLGGILMTDLFVNIVEILESLAREPG